MATKAMSQLKKTLGHIRKSIVCDADRAAIEPHLREIVDHFKADRPVKVVEVENTLHPHTIKVQERRIYTLKKQLEQQATLHNEAVAGLAFKVNQLTRQLAMAKPSLEGKTDEELLGHLPEAIKALEDRFNEVLRRASADGKKRVGLYGVVVAMAFLHNSLMMAIKANSGDSDLNEVSRHIAENVFGAICRMLDYYEIDVDEVRSAGTLAHYKDA